MDHLPLNCASQDYQTRVCFRNPISKSATTLWFLEVWRENIVDCPTTPVWQNHLNCWGNFSPTCAPSVSHNAPLNAFQVQEWKAAAKFFFLIFFFFQAVVFVDEQKSHISWKVKLLKWHTIFPANFPFLAFKPISLLSIFVSLAATTREWGGEGLCAPCASLS